MPEVSTTIPEGWYPDPQAPDGTRERWWNGHQWTAHTRGAQQPRASTAPPPVPYAGRSPQSGPLYATPPPTLPDGTPLAETGERVGAHALDLVLVWVVATVLADAVHTATGIGSYFLSPLGLPWFLFGGWLDGLLIGGTWLAYQLAFRGSGGRTLGKRLLRLRVRPVDAEGPLTTGQVLRRAVLGGGGVLFLMFPAGKLLGPVLLGVDLHRTSRDPFGRPWHDQVAGTAVVKAPSS